MSIFAKRYVDILELYGWNRSKTESDWATLMTNLEITTSLEDKSYGTFSFGVADGFVYIMHPEGEDPRGQELWLVMTQETALKVLVLGLP